MNNFFNVFGKLPIGGQLMNLCFCSSETDEEENYGGIGAWSVASGKSNRKNTPQYKNTTPLAELPPEEKNKAQNYLNYLESQGECYGKNDV